MHDALPYFSRILAKLVFVISACLCLYATPVLAIAKGYQTNDALLVPGMVAAFEGTSDGATVSRATLETSSKVIGVATSVADSTVTITSSNAQVYVESQGEVLAYVSDINGQVLRGDMLTVSPLKGMLMKASIDNGDTIVALAADNFTTDKAESYDLQGGEKARVEKLMVNLDQKNLGSNGSTTESYLQKLGRSVTGRSVSQLRVLIAMVIFIIVMIAEGAIIYGGVTSAITAIGRNPLARDYIKKELFQVMGVVSFVLVVGLASIYAILWV